MFREFAWRTFENTGSVDAYMLFREIEVKDKAVTESIIAQEEVAISN
jgi:hypothetical protein